MKTSLFTAALILAWQTARPAAAPPKLTPPTSLLQHAGGKLPEEAISALR